MRTRRTTVATLTATALLGSGLALTASPAYAAPAPSCVKTRVYNTASDYTVQVRNACNRTVRVKIVMRLGRDSKCTTLRKGEYLYHRTTGLQTWKETVTC
ncbi:hypothetical protein [Streptomyces koyangensis]|uniref:hypothetical protein n=1 Tax=Streptomyces koyangensis TaxID=188770 RepID=UPI003C2C768E